MWICLPLALMHRCLYVSCFTDPGVNLFYWLVSVCFLCFPTISPVLPVFAEDTVDKATCIIEVPKWLTQPYYSILTSMLVEETMVASPAIHNLLMPNQLELASEMSGRPSYWHVLYLLVFLWTPLILASWNNGGWGLWFLLSLCHNEARSPFSDTGLLWRG